MKMQKFCMRYLNVKGNESTKSKLIKRVKEEKEEERSYVHQYEWTGRNKRWKKILKIVFFFQS